jgi:pyrroline-5-carboxylate reductase
MMDNKKITIIGGGNLGVAILLGLIESKDVAPQNITITRRNISALQFLEKEGVNISDNNFVATQNADIVLLAVKPYQIKEVLKEIQPALNVHQLLISVVSSVSLADILEIVQLKMPVFRAMPNTAIAIRQSMTCISYLNTNAAQSNLVVSLFQKLGEAIIIEEDLMEAATVLGACGTAYAMRYIRANIQGGIEIGFSAQTARLIAAQTVKGAAELLLKNGTHPESEIDKVTTPKGCTIAGLNEMEHQGFSSSLIRGLIASYQKIRKD